MSVSAVALLILSRSIQRVERERIRHPTATDTQPEDESQRPGQYLREHASLLFHSVSEWAKKGACACAVA